MPSTEHANDNDVMDLVDANDNVIGDIHQLDAPSLLTSKAGFIRGTVALILNEEGKIWTPRRGAQKNLIPNGLDFSVAEHVQKGESYRDGLVRGFKEELLWDIDPAKLSYLGKLDPLPQIPYFFTAVFTYPANEVARYNTNDFSGYEWLHPQEIVERINRGEPAKDALKLSIERFILK